MWYRRFSWDLLSLVLSFLGMVLSFIGHSPLFCYKVVGYGISERFEMSFFMDDGYIMN